MGPKTVRGLHCLHLATLGKDSACSGCCSFRDSAHKALKLWGQEIRGQSNHPPQQPVSHCDVKTEKQKNDAKAAEEVKETLAGAREAPSPSWWPCRVKEPDLFP